AKNSRYNDQTLDNSLRELNKRLPTLGGWPKLLDVYITLYNWDPDSPKSLNYLYWILRSSEKLGKTEQEKRDTIKAAKVEVPDEFIVKSAEEILSDAIIRNINDPRKENVEMLIGDLANRIARKARLANRKTDGPKINAEDEVTTLLKLKEGQSSLIAQARGYYTRAEVARLMRDEEKREENLHRIATIFKAEELSPTILGTVGDYLLTKNDYEKADIYFQYILDHFRSSDFADFGFAGKAEILLHQDKAKDAYNLCQEAIDNGILFSKEKEIVMTRSRALLGLSDLVTSGKADASIIEIAKNINQSAKTFADNKLKDAEKAASDTKEALATKEAAKAKDVAKARADAAEASTKLATAKEQVSQLEEAGRTLASGGGSADRVANETFLTSATQGFTEISANREWRGEATGFALYYLGQVEERRGKVNEAINYYRRCFLAWKKYSNVTGKAYLRTAELENEKLRLPDKAKETLQDMLRADNPASKSPEAAKAREMLRKL
ncbi:MAG: hypothetical protein LBV12_02995, partial [Puniceicoccales bacterium]|nr:hypothetical protein [Puniceicoccales bacterium]